MMIAFLVFFALMIACIVGGLWISMYLYKPRGTRSLSEHRLVTLSQEAFIVGRPYKPRRIKVDMDMGMRECARRVGGVSLGVMAVMVLLIVMMFVNVSH